MINYNYCIMTVYMNLIVVGGGGKGSMEDKSSILLVSMHGSGDALCMIILIDYICSQWFQAHALMISA